MFFFIITQISMVFSGDSFLACFNVHLGHKIVIDLFTSCFIFIYYVLISMGNMCKMLFFISCNDLVISILVKFIELESCRITFFPFLPLFLINIDYFLNAFLMTPCSNWNMSPFWRRFKVSSSPPTL